VFSLGSKKNHHHKSKRIFVKIINATAAPPPGGHYSHAVESNGLVFVSGVLPGKPAEGEVDHFERQVRATLKHCLAILTEAGCTFDHVVQTTAYIVGVANWPEFNRIYKEILGEHRPARAVVPVPELHHGFLVEIQLVAEKPVR
jgi:reactive intermediate/imine deaminase